jgi:hypothetical protein
LAAEAHAAHVAYELMAGGQLLEVPTQTLARARGARRQILLADDLDHGQRRRGRHRGVRQCEVTWTKPCSWQLASIVGLVITAPIGTPPPSALDSARKSGPAWSPNGRYVASIGGLAPTDTTELHLFRSRRGGHLVIDLPDRLVSLGPPNWQPRQRSRRGT